MNRLSIRPLLTFYQDTNCSLVSSAAAIINKFQLIALTPRFKPRYGFSILLPAHFPAPDSHSQLDYKAFFWLKNPWLKYVNKTAGFSRPRTMFVCKSRQLPRISIRKLIGRLISLCFLKILQKSRGQIKNFPEFPTGPRAVRSLFVFPFFSSADELNLFSFCCLFSYC